MSLEIGKGGNGCIVLQKLLKRIISLPNKNALSEKQQVVFPFLSGLQRVWVSENVSKTIFPPLHFYVDNAHARSMDVFLSLSLQRRKIFIYNMILDLDLIKLMNKM